MRDGAERQLIVELEPERSPITIGRQPASDVALSWDDEVSRAHADVECIGDVWTLVDDGRSRNGSFVNGERVHGRRPLRHGDVLALGRTTLTFVAPVASGAGSTAVGSARTAPALSPAQRRVLVALCRPFADARFATPPSNRELADELFVSVETVKFHLHALFELFGLAVPGLLGARAARALAQARRKGHEPRTCSRPRSRAGSCTAGSRAPYPPEAAARTPARATLARRAPHA